MRLRAAHLAGFIAAASVTHCVHVRPELRVRELRFHGTHQIDESDLREHLATRETQIWPGQRGILRWWRWPWREPEYFEEGAFARDRLRIRSYYNSHGYFDAEVTSTDVQRYSALDVNLDVTLREGAPTHLADVRLRGCVRDGGLVPDTVCDRLWESVSVRRDQIPVQERVSADRDLLLEGLRNRGYPSPRVIPRIVVDPAQRLAWTDYTLVPGPVGTFGNVRLHVLPNTAEITGDRLPNGLPTRVIRSAMAIDRGARYSRRTLINSQQSLFDLGVFGVARIEEHPRPDGVVDLDVQLSPARLWRLRLGGGFEIDPTRNNFHLTAAYERRNFFGLMERLRAEVRPQLYIPSLFLSEQEQSGEIEPGISISTDGRFPEVWRHTAVIGSLSFDYGPDPINPSIALRESFRPSLGIERHFTNRITGSLYGRFAQVSYAPSHNAGSTENFSQISLAGQQYLDQSWVYLEQSFVYDGRNDHTHATRGTFVSATLSEGLKGFASDYTFVRGQVDARQYIPLTRSFTFAVRGAVGLTVGDTDNAAGWPVPQELRFYSGGAQSNRGYPYNRVGALGITRDQSNVIAIGGTAMWEFNAELRWQPNNFGVVAFFDASQVAGIDANAYANPGPGQNDGCATTASNPVLNANCATPPTRILSPGGVGDAIRGLTENAHPSIGFGLRYLTPFGPVRLDVGFRLAAGGCDTARGQIAAQNSAVAPVAPASTGQPAAYFITEPKCTSIIVTDSSIATLHLTLGEAF